MMNLNHFQINIAYRNDLLQQAAKRRLVREARREPARMRPFAWVRAQVNRQTERWEQPVDELYAETRVLEAGH